MSALDDRLKKLREDRIAREKARIEKLRELNLKKYNKNEPTAKPASNIPVPSKLVRSDSVTNSNRNINLVKNNGQTNGNAKRPSSVPVKKPSPTKNMVKSKTIQPKVDYKVNVAKKDATANSDKQIPATSKVADKKPVLETKAVKKDFITTNKIMIVSKNGLKTSRKSMGVPAKTSKLPLTTRPSMLPVHEKNNESVFDRLYKPKMVAKKHVNDTEKLQTDPNYLKKVIRTSGLILNKPCTVLDMKGDPVRRSISAVHFKRISKSEIKNCIHKWSSIGDKLNGAHLKNINEDEPIVGDTVSAVKSEKKVKFLTPIHSTPGPEDMQKRLTSWLQKRGKSLDSYHHLQCFGIHAPKEAMQIKPISTPKFELYDDEDKENVALDSDSDDGSYTENMNDIAQVKFDTKKWRSASMVSESVDLNETTNTTLASSPCVRNNVDDLLHGALNDLTDLLKEGFEWEQCLRWLRCVCSHFPHASRTSAYWECRAALEERRGDLPASLQCWEEAVANGAERSVVESNLDQLLDKFMQLKISPNGGKSRPIDPKMVDVKNVFKSTIIRFAVQQAKLQEANQSNYKYTLTPVRRSGRLSIHGRTPLRECTSVRQAEDTLGISNLVFVPNQQLNGTP